MTRSAPGDGDSESTVESTASGSGPPLRPLSGELHAWSADATDEEIATFLLDEADVEPAIAPTDDSEGPDFDEADPDREAIGHCIEEGLVNVDGDWFAPEDLIADGWSAEEIADIQRRQREDWAAR